MLDAGVSDAAVRLIWKKRTVTPLGGSSVMLRLTADVEFTDSGLTDDWPQPTKSERINPQETKREPLRIVTSLRSETYDRRANTFTAHANTLWKGDVHQESNSSSRYPLDGNTRWSTGLEFPPSPRDVRFLFFVA